MPSGGSGLASVERVAAPPPLRRLVVVVLRVALRWWSRSCWRCTRSRCSRSNRGFLFLPLRRGPTSCCSGWPRGSSSRRPRTCSPSSFTLSISRGSGALLLLFVRCPTSSSSSSTSPSFLPSSFEEPAGVRIFFSCVASPEEDEASASPPSLLARSSSADPEVEEEDDDDDDEARDRFLFLPPPPLPPPRPLALAMMMSSGSHFLTPSSASICSLSGVR